MGREPGDSKVTPPTGPEGKAFARVDGDFVRLKGIGEVYFNSAIPKVVVNALNTAHAAAVKSAVMAAYKRAASIAEEWLLDIGTKTANDLEVVQRTRDAIAAEIRKLASEEAKNG